MCDTEKIWQTLLREKYVRDDLQGKPGAVLRTEFIDRLPAVLSAVLDEKVTLATFLAAKIAITEFVLAGKIAEKVLPLYPEESREGETLEKQIALANNELLERIESEKQLAARSLNLQELLQSSEAWKIDTFRVMRDMIAEGTNVESFTIREFLERHPLLFLE